MTGPGALGPGGVERLVVLSLHTSPLAPPGTGDAGGLNVYVVEFARRLAARGVAVDIYTRRTRAAEPALGELAPLPGAAGRPARVHTLTVGPVADIPRGLQADLAPDFARAVARQAAGDGAGPRTVIHSHYWLSGIAGMALADRWRVPLVHTMHTTARAKLRARGLGESGGARGLGEFGGARGPGLAGDDPATVAARRRAHAEERIVGRAARLVVNTADEGRDLVELYGAEPSRVRIVAPGVDVEAFAPASDDHAAARTRQALGVPRAAPLALFVGRLQPFKGPEVAVRAVALARRLDPRLADLRLLVVGGPSGDGMGEPARLTALARALGVSGAVRLTGPVARDLLPEYYRTADVQLVPSRHETFGFVALEALAAGTPVIATDTGGLRRVVGDATAGVVVPGRDPADWARALSRVLGDRARLGRLSAAAPADAARFGWAEAEAAMIRAYGEALDASDAQRLAGAR